MFYTPLTKSSNTLLIEMKQMYDESPSGMTSSSQETKDMRKMEWRALDARVLVVAVEGYGHDWTAYIGAVPGKNFSTRI
jgi:hypothetical protein